MRSIVLASTSPYRAELLSRLGLEFTAAAPLYDENPVPGLAAPALALAHAAAKARSLLAAFPDAVIIGSDQAAEVEGEILGKPGSAAAAVAQLLRMSGKTVSFHTGLAVLSGGREFSGCERFDVTLRALTRAEVVDYVARENPVDCAGSFKIEGLGIALMEKLSGDDYTSLIGLPLIRLVSLLRLAGVKVLQG